MTQQGKINNRSPLSVYSAALAQCIRSTCGQRSLNARYLFCLCAGRLW